MDKSYYKENAYFTDPLDFEDIYLLQIGRLYCTESTVIDTHIHTDLFELTVVTGGAGRVITNGVSTAVRSGDIYLSLPCDIHRIESDSGDPLKYDFFAFRSKNADFNNELFRIAEEYHSPRERVFDDQRIKNLIARAISELSSPSVFSEQLLSSLFRQTVILLIRNFQSTPKYEFPDNTTEADRLCWRIMNYIDTHIYTMKRLSELCELTDYSYGYLSALFKKTTSESLSDYFGKKRTDAARLLLKENKLTVTEISEALGYSSPYAFSKAFKKQFGIAPRQYAKAASDKAHGS